MIHEATSVLDALDRQLLTVLQRDGRRSVADLARDTGLAPATVHARVRRLEADGVLRATVALVDAERLGFHLPCFVHIGLSPHRADIVAAFRASIAAIAEVTECHSATGDDDYLCKVLGRDRAHLAALTEETLTALPGVSRIRTSLVLRTVKHTTAVPVEPLEPATELLP